MLQAVHKFVVVLEPIVRKRKECQQVHCAGVRRASPVKRKKGGWRELVGLIEKILKVRVERRGGVGHACFCMCNVAAN